MLVRTAGAGVNWRRAKRRGFRGWGVAHVYKICKASEWSDAERAGVFRGAAPDLADGFIHFSDVSQVAETAARHFAGMDDLVLVAVAAAALGPSLKWEP